MPALGLGTWGWGEKSDRRDEEVRAVNTALDLGMTLVDTAEMYGDGASEELVGEALSTRRDEAFVVTKVLPHNASRQGTIDACRRSLRRLRTDHIDLFLLHWPGSYPLVDTVEAFGHLIDAGDIRHWGVSNFDVADLTDLRDTPDGRGVATNQVLYNLTRRGIEYDLLPWCARQGLPVMAYSPIEQGRIPDSAVLQEVAERHGVGIQCVALAWLLRHDNVCAIPSARSADHLRDNAAAWDVELSQQDFDRIDEAFPAPTEARPLDIR
ncbi:aldo/keto reductase [Allosaccharopolyspora coralli]|uniref:Aldo/keto reductase n=2 Tax=Allosaccharopolyspora coralli TaxID=2665642 RepID=A0A5Q3QG01_9PSEU|nr:aldo/keto reductase [Allosaccharopolyspora coralli]